MRSVMPVRIIITPIDASRILITFAVALAPPSPRSFMILPANEKMIKTKICDLFGIKYPILQAPMGPFVTTKLAIAVSEAGGLGTISHAGILNRRTQQLTQ
jgi:IMP dehydrogenase/GMP reductase